MSGDAVLTYRYDGTFEGMMCCVFESYYAHEIPFAVLTPDAPDMTLFGSKEIVTDEEKANRVIRSVPLKISSEAAELVRLAFFTCLEEKELAILKFLRLGYRLGRKIMYMEELDELQILKKAVHHLLSEAHLLRGFVRFSEYNEKGKRILVSVIGPKNQVLPFLANHFKLRLPEEHWLIYDEVHHQALVYRPHEMAVIPMDEFKAAVPDEEECKYRELWQGFYDAIEIKPRHNERCRMTLMPKRYWKYMTEFAQMDYSQEEKKMIE